MAIRSMKRVASMPLETLPVSSAGIVEASGVLGPALHVGSDFIIWMWSHS